MGSPNNDPVRTVHDAEYVAALRAVTRAFVFARMGRPHLRHLTDAQLGDLAGIAVEVLEALDAGARIDGEVSP